MRKILLCCLGLISSLLILRCDLDRVEDAGPFTCGQLFTDPRDGKTYKTIWIADDGSHNMAKPGHCWMAQSLDFNTANFNSNCYDEQASRCDTFGRMYGKFALPNICMNGWHIARVQEWDSLFITYGWTRFLTGDGPIFSGDSSRFLPGGNSKLDFLLGGSCLGVGDCDGAGESIGFWATGDFNFTSFNKGGSASIFGSGIIVGDPDLRYYVRCVQN